jgi:predicted homoserine dehydrogenase-like protein
MAVSCYRRAAVIIIDTALRKREEAGDPVRVGMIGAGFMARGIANSIVNSIPGMRLAAIANRTVETAIGAFTEAGADDVAVVETADSLQDALRAGRYVVTADPLLVAEADGIDVMLEVTGTVEHAAHVVLRAIASGKHVVLMNAELDGTIGPILKARADAAGVILSACDGDQPGVEMNLYRFVKGLGLRPLVCGNIKGLQDRTRNPTTQAGFAARWGMNVHMVTSFADGTKISFEQAIVANATGMRAPRRGLYGRDFEGHIDDLTSAYDIDELERFGGIVDYVVGASPPPGVYVFATHDDPRQRHYMNLYKRGEGPLYSFYTPYHLCHFEVPTSLARVALFEDAVLAPLAGPVVDVVATAKIDLLAGELVDGIGHYMTYGQCENSDVTRAEGLLPMGLAEGCRLVRDVPRDQVLTYADVELPGGRLADGLRAEQDSRFGGPA